MATISNVKNIAIDGNVFDRPPDFRPQRQDLYAGEITTCTGKLIADRIGWKYADVTLVFPLLTQAQVTILAGISGAVTFEFYDLDGGRKSEQVIRTSAVGLRNRNTIAGTVYWTDVTVTFRFLTPHA